MSSNHNAMELKLIYNIQRVCKAVLHSAEPKSAKFINFNAMDE